MGFGSRYRGVVQRQSIAKNGQLEVLNQPLAVALDKKVSTAAHCGRGHLVFLIRLDKSLSSRPEFAPTTAVVFSFHAAARY